MLDESDLDCVSGDLDAPVRQGGRSLREILSGKDRRDRAFGIRYKISKDVAEKIGITTTGDARQDVVVRSNMAGGYLAAIDPSCTGDVSYARNWDRYEGHSHPLMKYRIVVPSIDHLIETGIATGVKAKRGDHLRTGRQSTYRLKDHVVHALHGEGLEVDPNFESCRLRSADKKAQAWPQTDKARAIQYEMDHVINPFLRSITATMPDDIEQVGPGIYRCPLDVTKPLPRLKPRKGRRMPTDEERQANRPTHNLFVAIDLAAHRVFNRGDEDLVMGGRLFGPWQSLWSEVRKRILLNGAACQELDYECLHAKMAYGLAGQRCPKDPYTVKDRHFSRRQGKIAFLIMLNAKDRDEAIAAIAWAFDLETKVASRLYHEVVRKNRAIKDTFASDLGIRLMNADAEICLAVLRECIERNIPCLPVHDSFIVPETEVEVVEEIKDRVLADWLRICRRPKTVSVSNPVEVRDSLVLHMVGPVSPSSVCPPAPASVRAGLGSSSVQDEALPRLEEVVSLLRLLHGGDWVERAKEADEAELRRRAFRMVSPWSITPTLDELRRYRTWSALRASLEKPRVVPSTVPSTGHVPFHSRSRPVATLAARTPISHPVQPVAVQSPSTIDPADRAFILRLFPGAIIAKVETVREAA